jgi:hypothetical protein
MFFQNLDEVLASLSTSHDTRASCFVCCKPMRSRKLARSVGPPARWPKALWATVAAAACRATGHQGAEPQAFVQPLRAPAGPVVERRDGAPAGWAGPAAPLQEGGGQGGCRHARGACERAGHPQGQQGRAGQGRALDGCVDGWVAGHGKGHGEGTDLDVDGWVVGTRTGASPVFTGWMGG